MEALTSLHSVGVRPHHGDTGIASHKATTLDMACQPQVERNGAVTETGNRPRNESSLLVSKEQVGHEQPVCHYY
ncbi:MAG: hypothetical protein KF747_20485 [Nitrospira sp.]|uniref:hypothetical protein n=1 Tax=Nitrospira sp. BLG_1 TaxID=3395883 RepID=UPI0039BC325F|nr:hypothetical protein [Nitrospira sp.]